MKKLLLWSGGFDSTAILLDWLENKIEFDTVYINLENNYYKSLAEKDARLRILKKLETKYSKESFGKDYEIKINPVYSENKGGFWQPYLWINSLVTHIKEDKYSEIAFGYIKKDMFWHIKSEALKMFKYSWIVFHCNYKNIPELIYPYEWYYKEDIFLNSKEFNKEILKMTITCENPIIFDQLSFDLELNDIKHNDKIMFKECGECDTCKRKIELFKNLNNFKDVVCKKEIE